MNRSHRIHARRFTSSLSLGAALLAASTASAAPANDAARENREKETLASKLDEVLAVPGGLTSDVVAARAEASSFDLKAKQADLEAAAAGVDQALIAYFPRLAGTARYTRLSSLEPPSLGTISFPVILNQYLLQATLSVPLSDYILRIPQNYAAATRSAMAAELTEKATRLKVAADARAFYYSWVRAKLQRVVAEQALEQAKAHVVDVGNAFQAGTVSRADVLRFQSQVASSQLLLERAESFASISETQLRIAMHDATDQAYEVGEAVDAGAPPSAESEGLSGLWAEATSHRFELRALAESAGATRDQAKVARAGYWPRLDGVADLIHANPNQRVFPQEEAYKTTWDAGLSLTWSPNDFANASASSGGLEARAASLTAQRQTLADAIRLEVTQARNSLREARQAIESSSEGLAAAEESYRVRRSLFQNGRATSVELTDAETDLTRSRLDAINARVDLQVARVRLAQALGRGTLARR